MYNRQNLETQSSAVCFASMETDDKDGEWAGKSAGERETDSSLKSLVEKRERE